MGDPTSVGMTIGACAWMEHEWQQSISERDKQYYRAKRFMDDVIMLYVKTPAWDSERFVADFERSECYMEPLKLEAGKAGTFLETSFEVQAGQLRHWLKNDNLRGTEPKVWRYQHFQSHMAFRQKRATLTACLRKVDKMASDPMALRNSALDKLAEFKRLGYPDGMLWAACSKLGATTGRNVWFGIRHKL